MNRSNILVRSFRGLVAGLLLAAPALALASAGGVSLDKAKVNVGDHASLQRGAKAFVTYCLNCHSASMMRYNRLKDIGFTEKQIQDELIFTGRKIGDHMTIAMDPKAAQAWFGATPPDLTVIARSRGADWLYTYLRSFYRDSERPTGWNNKVFDKVGMPHVLFDLQGEQVLKKAGKDDPGKLEIVKPGKMKPAEYDALVGDLVNYLVYMGEPAQAKRTSLGVVVLIFLGIFFAVSWMLKKEFWKDIH